MKAFFLHEYIPLLFLVILSDFQSKGSSVSLYNTDDKVTILNKDNFFTSVYHSKTAWLIEFYANWCGHCQSYAHIYREIAIDAWPWKTIVRVAAVNCFGEEKIQICRQHNIGKYPTLCLVPPNAIFSNTSKLTILSSSEIPEVKKDLFQALERLRRQNSSWPYLTPLNRVTLEELYARAPITVKLVLVIVEKRHDLTGREVMLDFSRYRKKIAIFRTTTDGKLWRKFRIKNSDVPALFVILRNRTAQRIPLERSNNFTVEHRILFHQTIRSYVESKKLLDQFDDSEWNEFILMQKSNISRPVNMIDLEIALHQMFREEIPLVKTIEDQTYLTLVQWLDVLIKYFPGREPVMMYLQQLMTKVRAKPSGFTGNEFLEMTKFNSSSAYLPDHRNRYQHCLDSTSQSRGYPCSLWLLFHTLTVSQIQQDSISINVTEIPWAIRRYITHFFSCRHCSENFGKETNKIDQLDPNNRYEALIYLWTIHNSVNRRLHGDVSEFPPRFLCPNCRLEKSEMNNETFNLTNVIDFLLEFYSKENIERSTIIDKPIGSTISSFKLTTIEIPQFSWYFIFVLVIFIVGCRRQFFQRKKQRYTN